MKDRFTGERLERTVYTRSTIDHLHRYALASNYVAGQIVLDIASGEGYGSNILASKALKVFGVDIDLTTVNLASAKYNLENIDFLVGSTSFIPLTDNSVDVVVSFETIEHHDEHDQMMKEIKRVLKKDGLLIISTPDKSVYSDLRNYCNPFHVKELYKDQFINLAERFYKRIEILNQFSLNINSYIVKENCLNDFVVYSGSFEEVIEDEKNPMFTILVCSDVDIVTMENSTFNGKFVSDELRKIQILKIKESLNYRLGAFLTKPVRRLRRFFKRK